MKKVAPLVLLGVLNRGRIARGTIMAITCALYGGRCPVPICWEVGLTPPGALFTGLVSYVACGGGIVKEGGDADALENDFIGGVQLKRQGYRPLGVENKKRNGSLGVRGTIIPRSGKELGSTQWEGCEGWGEGMWWLGHCFLA